MSRLFRLCRRLVDELLLEPGERDLVTERDLYDLESDRDRVLDLER